MQEIKNGLRFKTNNAVFEVVEMYDPNQPLICTIEVSRSNGNAHNTVNRNYYQYFSRDEIINAYKWGIIS